MRTRYRMLLAGSLVLLPLSPFSTLGAQVQSSGLYEVKGIVVDASRVPVPSAELVLKRPGQHNVVVRSDNEGRFSFPDVRSGPIALTVRRMGYTAKTINIDVNAARVAA